MLTPQEVSERAFQKASFGGYNMGQVDEFLDLLTTDYTSLYNENAVLKSKMKVLVDKVEEYRSTEEAMRKALMAAQKMADELVKEAEEKKAGLLRKAEEEIRDRMGALSKQVEAEEFRLQKARQATASFVEKVRALQGQEEEFLSRLQELCPEAPPADPVAETVSEIDDNVQRLLARAMQEAAAEGGQEDGAPEGKEEDEEQSGDTAEFPPVTGAEAEKREEAPERPARRVDFSDLQFGRAYEIK